MAEQQTRVLCIEDSEDDVLLVKRLLAKNTNGKFALLHASTLKHGLELLNSDWIDVILLDLGLSDSNGLNTLMKLKQLYPEKPVLVMTGYDDEKIGIQAVRRGAQDYLVKGQVSSDLLIRSIEYAIERMRMEEALRQSEEELRLMFESVAEGIAITDLKGRIIRANEALADMHGFLNQSELLGRVAFELVDLKHRKKCMEEFNKTVKYGSASNNEFMLLKNDGRWFPAEVSATLLKDTSKKPYAVAFVIRDATERKFAEEENKRKTAQLAQKTEELQKANKQLKEADRLKSIFLASMSHELRTPLNSVIGFTGLILRGLAGDLTSTQKEHLTVVKSSAQHLLSLINDVLDISKIEAGKVELSLEEFSLDEMTDEVMDTLSPIAALKGLPIILDIPQNITLFNDKRRTKQILINLLSNAIKFTEAGQISLKTVVKSKGTIQMSVQDTGMGIKRTDLSNLFQPFQQVSAQVNKRSDGTGLGLYLSQKLATLMGGNISAKSKYGHGSRFTVTLPLIHS